MALYPKISKGHQPGVRNLLSPPSRSTRVGPALFIAAGGQAIRSRLTPDFCFLTKTKGAFVVDSHPTFAPSKNRRAPSPSGRQICRLPPSPSFLLLHLLVALFEKACLKWPNLPFPPVLRMVLRTGSYIYARRRRLQGTRKKRFSFQYLQRPPSPSGFGSLCRVL